MLIFFASSRVSIVETILNGETEMKIHMDASLKFWVDVEYATRRSEGNHRNRNQITAEVLREYEECGDAMRHLNPQGEIAWKPSPIMLLKLCDAEREAEADLVDLP